MNEEQRKQLEKLHSDIEEIFENTERVKGRDFAQAVEFLFTLGQLSRVCGILAETSKLSSQAGAGLMLQSMALMGSIAGSYMDVTKLDEKSAGEAYGQSKRLLERLEQLERSVQ